VRPPVASRAPIILVHGMFASAWPFANYQRYFADLGHATYAPDLRGHGASPPVPDLGGVRIRDFTDDVLRVVDHVARTDGPPVLLGHSMGGLVAQLAAARAPPPGVRALVLLCSAPPRGIPVLSVPLLRRLPPQLPGLVLSRPIMPRRSDADDLMFNRVPAAERDALFAGFTAESGRAGRELALGAVAVHRRDVACPVLSVGAEDDRTVPVAVSRRIAEHYGATHLAFAGHGHFILLEPGWEIPAAAIARWLESTLAR
jgi:pimeloyl-ACP methyl ester carboxylesterase